MKKSVLIVSISAAVLALTSAAAIGGVYALFQDKTDVTYHIESGSLNVTPYLSRRYQKSTTYPSGKTETLDPEVDLSQDGSELFTLGDASKPLYPGVEEATELEVKPASGTSLGVAMDLSISLTSVQGYVYQNDSWVKSDNCVLLSQIKVTLAKGKLETPTDASSFLLSELPATAYSVGSYAADATLDSFATIRYQFLNLDNTTNNLAQHQRFSFDFVVDAVQQAI
jgi:hypothetical protein